MLPHEQRHQHTKSAADTAALVVVIVLILLGLLFVVSRSIYVAVQQ